MRRARKNVQQRGFAAAGSTKQTDKIFLIDFQIDVTQCEEQDIGNPSVLSSLAQEIGLDQSTFETALSEGIYREKLNEIESEVLQSIQPKTIPTILIGDSIRLDGGAYTPAQFRAFLDRASKEQQDITTISGAGCGENGCGF